MDFVHGYVYARWPNRYIGFLRGADAGPRPVRRGKPRDLGRFSRYFQEHYHSKVLRPEEAEKIVRLDRPVVVENPERIVPFAIANRIVMETPGTLAVIDCPCRETRGEAGCRPRDVCLLVGSPFAEFVVEHGVNRARAITRNEASDILRRTGEAGCVHTAWFKDAMGGRFYAICNCCPCCCGAMGAMRKSGFAARYVQPSGYVSHVDADRCDGCGSCREWCPFGAVSVNGKAEVAVEHCYGCGVCRTKCGKSAIELVLEPSRGVPLDLDTFG